MKCFQLALTAAALVAITLPASAQGKGSASKGAVAKGPGQAAKAPSHGAKAPTSTGGAAKSGATSSATSAAATTGSTKTATAATTTGTTTTAVAPPTAISLKLAKNPTQLARVQSMLPAGMTIEDASAGFRNQGQFIAALNVAKNRGIPFADLQQAMTVEGLSLGQAAKKIQALPVPPTTGTGTPGTGTTGTGTTTTNPSSPATSTGTAATAAN